jgi:hypothetical protein
MGKHNHLSGNYLGIGGFLAGIVLATSVDGRNVYMAANESGHAYSGQVVQPLKKKSSAEKEAFYEQFYRH